MNSQEGNPKCPNCNEELKLIIDRINGRVLVICPFCNYHSEKKLLLSSE